MILFSSSQLKKDTTRRNPLATHAFTENILPNDMQAKPDIGINSIQRGLEGRIDARINK